MNFGLQARTLSGGNWLSLDTTRGSATFGAPFPVGITLSSALLATSTYSGEVTVTDLGSNQTQKAIVLLAVNTRSLAIQLSQAALEFTASTSGGVASPQTFAVSNTGQGQMNWSLETQTLGGGSGWLRVTPMTGASASGAAAPPLVTVSVNPAGVPVGRHFRLVRVSAPGAANSPQLLSVVLNMVDAAGATGPLLSDEGALIVSDSGNPTAAIAIANLSGRALTYVSTRSTEDGRDWLAISPPSGTLAPDRATNVTIQPNFAGLAPGVRRGTLRLGFTDGSVRTIGVTSIVPSTTTTATIQSKAGAHAANCQPQGLVLEFKEPGAAFVANGTEGKRVRVSVADTSRRGNALTSGGVSLQLATRAARASRCRMPEMGFGLVTGSRRTSTRWSRWW